MIVDRPTILGLPKAGYFELGALINFQKALSLYIHLFICYRGDIAGAGARLMDHPVYHF